MAKYSGRRVLIPRSFCESGDFESIECCVDPSRRPGSLESVGAMSDRISYSQFRYEWFLFDYKKGYADRISNFILIVRLTGTSPATLHV